MPAQPVTAAPVNILDNEDLYNVIVLGGVTSPGKVVLAGHDHVAKWDVQSGPFMAGARTILKNIIPVEFTATFSLLRDLSQGIDDFKTWPAFRRIIESTITPAAQSAPITLYNQAQLINALPIYHPALSANKITAVAMARIGGEVYDGKGGMVVVVTFQQYKPFKIMGGAAVVKPKAPDPNQDVQDQIKAVTDRGKLTAWG